MSTILVKYDGTNFVVQEGSQTISKLFNYSDLNIREANVNTIRDFNQLFRRRDIEKDAKESPSVQGMARLMVEMFPGITLNNKAVGLPNLEKLKKVIKDSATLIPHPWLKTETLNTRLHIQKVFYETCITPSDFIMKGGEIIGNFASEVGDPFVRSSPNLFWPEANKTIIFDHSILEEMGVPEPKKTENNYNRYEATMYSGTPPLFDFNVTVMGHSFGGSKISRERNKTGKPNHSGYDYLQGNDKKNRLINSAGKNEVLNAEKIKHFWGKEYGDMMQVMFMLAWKIYTGAKDNTFSMVTHDDVVFVTSILLKLPCIYTYHKNEKGIKSKDKIHRIQQYQGDNVDPVERKKQIISMVEDGILENNNTIIDILRLALQMGSITLFLGINPFEIDFSRKPKVKEWFELRIAQIVRINERLTSIGREIGGDDTEIQENNRARFLVNEFITFDKKKGAFKIIPSVKSYTHIGGDDNKIHFSSTFQVAFIARGGVPSKGLGRTIRSAKATSNIGKFGNNTQKTTTMTKYIQQKQKMADMPAVPMTFEIIPPPKEYTNGIEFSFEKDINFVKNIIAQFCETKKEDELQQKYKNILIGGSSETLDISEIRKDLSDTLYHRLAYYSYIFSWVPYDNFLTSWLEIIYAISYTDDDSDSNVFNQLKELFLEEKADEEAYENSLAQFEPEPEPERITEKRKREKSSSSRSSGTRKKKALSKYKSRTQSKSSSKMVLKSKSSST